MGVKRNIGLIAVLVVAISSLLSAGRYLARHPRAGAAWPAPDQSFVRNGTPAPDFELKLVDGQGKTMRLSSLRGKAVLVNFWATWCAPCKVELPWLVELQQQYGPQGLQIVGVAMDDADEKAIAGFTREMKLNYPVLLGSSAVAGLYGGVDGYPTSFFVDRSGRIVAQESGLVSESVIAENIRNSLNAPDNLSKP